VVPLQKKCALATDIFNVGTNAGAVGTPAIFARGIYFLAAIVIHWLTLRLIWVKLS
jgi:hypothetical protein